MADVVSFAPKPVIAKEVCPMCGGENGQHKEIYIPWMWPFNKSVFSIVDCPLKEVAS
jgi:hypothetical protein